MICVRIPKETLRGFGADIHAMLHTLDALRKAGIPVTGSLGVMDVTSGDLRMFNGAINEDVLWSWVPPAAVMEDLS